MSATTDEGAGPFGPVRADRLGRVLVMTLDRPEARNAVDPTLAQGLEGALDLLEEAVALAERICLNAPLAVRASRRAIVDGRDLSEDARYALGDRELAALMRTEDFAEGPAAFVEKRAPRWRPR